MPTDNLGQGFRKGMAGIACLLHVWSPNWKYLKVGSYSMTGSLDHLQASSIICLSPGLGELKDQDF